MIGERSAMNARNIRALVQKEDWDWLTVYDGDERVGKSTLSIGCMLAADPLMCRHIECEDYDKFLARVSFSFDDWLSVIQSTPDGEGIMYDEASVLGREAMKDHNLRMIRVMTTIGMRNLDQRWTFPSMWMLDPYLREGRVKTRAYVFTKNIDGVVQRGFVTWYVRKKYPWPRADGSTIWWLNAFTDSFTPISDLGPTYAELWEKYEEKANAHKRSVYQAKTADPKKQIAFNLRDRGMSIREIAPILGMSVPQVGTWLKGTADKYIPPTSRVRPDKRFKT